MNWWYDWSEINTDQTNYKQSTGAALDMFPGYKEVTSDSVCTQYSSANCEKY